MEYFEGPKLAPGSDGICSNPKCPCGNHGTRIPRGSGYMYVSEAVVSFRRDARTARDAEEKLLMIQTSARMGGIRGLQLDQNDAIPILMCVKGAKKRGLDLEVAAADAKYWWETGLVPLRATPLAARVSGLARFIGGLSGKK